MVTITVLCSNCYSSTRLSGSEVVVRADVAEEAQLSFLCKRCESVSVSTLTAEWFARLQAAGVAVESSTPSHPEQAPSGPALTRDDLLDLHLLLTTDGWFAALEQLAATRLV
jgi:hypothetical protein